MTDQPVVLITGAARRIGACIANTFHKHGYKLIAHYNSSADEAEVLVDSLNANRTDSALALQADLTDANAVEGLAAQALQAFGRVDVLVNNASTYYPTPIADATQQQWDELIDSNLRAAFFLSRSLAKELIQRNGAIVNITDIYADRPAKQHPIYSIAKAGLKAMTKSLAIELAPNVRVNSVAPGATIWPAALENTDDPAVMEKRNKILGQIPLGDLGNPIHIADTVYFLASGASYVTGEVIKVDGGKSLV